MRILFLAPYVPSRIRVRPFQFIKGLAKRHQLHVISLGSPAGEKMDGADELRAITEDFKVVPHSNLVGLCQSLAALPTRTPMCSAYCRSAAMSREVGRILQDNRFDAVHIEHIRAACFLPDRIGAPTIFDSVDCLAGLFGQMASTGSDPLRRLVAAEEAWKLRRYEPRTAKRFDGIVITSQSEKQALSDLDASLRIDVVPNGVDAEYFSPSGVRKSPRRIIFTGKMGYRPNADAAVWFAEQVFESLQNKWSDAELVIAGSGPPESVRRLAGRAGVSVTGYVADLRPHMDASAISVAPMGVAVGVQNKVLEAMAMGLPVVMSPLAARSVGECDSAVVAESADEWTEAISRLMEDPDRASELGRSNREWVRARYSWDSSVRLLESVYDRVIAGRC